MTEPKWDVHEVKYATCKVDGLIFVVRRCNSTQTEWGIWGSAGGKLASGVADTFEQAQQAALEAYRALEEAGREVPVSRPVPAAVCRGRAVRGCCSRHADNMACDCGQRDRA